MTMFDAADVDAAERLLAHECAENLPLIGDAASPTGLERIRFAVIRVSGGRLDRLSETITLARKDWRDVLVAAEFAHDVRAHERWKPQRFDGSVLDRWMAGELPPGVHFKLNESVRVVAGWHGGMSGSVIALLGLEPEPQYLIELGSGQTIEEFQRTLSVIR